MSILSPSNTNLIAAMLLAISTPCCGGAAVETAPPTSSYLRWGDKGADDIPSLVEPDHDEDGVLNGVDRCPDLPEDVDGYQDADGCPDPGEDKDEG